jgi:hypothetical protein
METRFNSPVLGLAVVALISIALGPCYVSGQGSSGYVGGLLDDGTVDIPLCNVAGTYNPPCPPGCGNRYKTWKPAVPGQVYEVYVETNNHVCTATLDCERMNIFDVRTKSPCQPYQPDPPP